MKNLSFSAYTILIASVASSHGAMVFISDLGGLGAPDETLNALNSALPTFNGRTVNGVTGVDLKDATFALSVDFNDPAGASSQNQILWETGGGTIGLSLVYVPSSMTLSLRQASNGGNTVLQVDSILSGAQKAGGDVELVWTLSTNGGPGGQPQIELFLDGVSGGTDTDPSALGDWSGGNGAGFGGNAAGGIAAAGANTNLGNTADFADGTINLTTGLQFWSDTQAVYVPEPSTGLLGLAALALLGIRRR
jgi:hypothetical protein